MRVVLCAAAVSLLLLFIGWRPIFFIGTLGAYWTLERSLVLLVAG